mgnify:CR=1 FL=1
MDPSNTIVEYKSQFDSLTSNFLKTYMNLETTFSQMKCDLSNQLLRAHQTNEKLTEIVSQKEQDLQILQGKVTDLEKKISDKSTLPEETSENKFDIIRGQAKEIAAKDKEIMRLVNELSKLKEDTPKEDTPKENTKNTVEKVVGWSPTTNSTPEPELPSEIKLDSDNSNDKSVEVEDDVVDTVSSNEVKDNDSEEEEFEMITYRKVNYYLDSKQKVYEIVKDEDGDDDVGKCVGDWVKQTSGKFKLIKH